jgi:hypothetical protein
MYATFVDELTADSILFLVAPASARREKAADTASPSASAADLRSAPSRLRNPKTHSRRETIAVIGAGPTAAFNGD